MVPPAMVFSSQVFLFYFLPLALAGNYLLPVRWRNVFLTIVSYAFYGWWSPWFVGLMFVSSFVDWSAGALLVRPGASPRRRRTILGCAVASNLLLLGFFKYFMFAAENVNRLLAALGHEPFHVMHVVLPVGISFYTFQSMSYTIDLYRGDAQKARSFGDFLCFVALFPQLVAGPIVRYQDLADQLVQRPQRGELFADGALSFMLGFAKKVLVANTLSVASTLAFDRAAGLSPLGAWTGLLAYTLQMYFDFSGYSDMAVGLGKMIGFTFVQNFRSPYRAESVTDYWKRWHISLTTWLRDYVYVPLSGNRGSRARTLLNLVTVFLISGLWHGAAWHYVAFGAVHGTIVLLERIVPGRCLWSFLPRPLRVVPTFAFVMVAFVVFRADGMPAVLDYWRALFVGSGPATARVMSEATMLSRSTCFALVMGLAIVFLGRETRLVVEAARSRLALAGGAVALFAWSVFALFTQAENPFLYFQF